MDDVEFEDRVKAIEWIVAFAGPPAEILRGKRVVEIGAGFGCGAVAAVRNGAAHYLGIEPEPFGSRIMQTEGFDPAYRLTYERAARAIDKARIRFFEGYAHEWPTAGFDLCLIADVLEHVESPKVMIADAARLIRPGGHIIASTGPLFYSAQGHHLFDVFRGQPWAHLRSDFDPSFLPAVVSSYLLSEYETLNRVTHADLLETIKGAGLGIVRERTIADETADLREYEHLIDAAHSVDRSVFDQSVSQILARKPS